jgi:hypothetical protein
MWNAGRREQDVPLRRLDVAQSQMLRALAGQDQQRLEIVVRVLRWSRQGIPS